MRKKKKDIEERIPRFDLQMTSVPSKILPKKMKNLSLPSLFNCNHNHSVLPFPDENIPAKDKNLQLNPDMPL